MPSGPAALFVFSSLIFFFTFAVVIQAFVSFDLHGFFSGHLFGSDDLCFVCPKEERRTLCCSGPLVCADFLGFPIQSPVFLFCSECSSDFLMIFC